MQSALKQLYNGEINPLEKMKPILEDYRESSERLCRQQAEFISKLEKFDRRLKFELEDLMAAADNLVSETMAQNFTDGFSLGVRLSAEIFLK